MAEESNDKKITEYFKKNNAEVLCNLFQGKTEKVQEMGIEMSLIVCDEITKKGNQCHVRNAAFKACLEEYDKLYVHIAGGNKSITIKMADNFMILAHQVKQWNKLMDCEDNDEWKEQIEGHLEGTTFQDSFERLFRSMSSIFITYFVYFFM